MFVGFGDPSEKKEYNMINTMLRMKVNISENREKKTNT